MKSANPTQQDLFDAGELAEAGAAEVIGHTKTSWHFAMLATAERWLREGKTFTSEDLTDAVGMPPHQSGAVGAFMVALVRTHKLRSHGRVGSKHKSSHGAKLEVWGR